MAKAFKWLLPGAVKEKKKKMTTQKKQNKPKIMLEREQRTKNIQQRCDTQPFPHPNHMCMHVNSFILQGNKQFPFFFLIKRDKYSLA